MFKTLDTALRAIPGVRAVHLLTRRSGVEIVVDGGSTSVIVRAIAHHLPIAVPLDGNTVVELLDTSRTISFSRPRSPVQVDLDYRWLDAPAVIGSST